MSRPSVDSAAEQAASDLPAVAPVVVVLGMHRSGTSLLARIVNLCGVSSDPDEQLMRPSRDNERGYWEPRYLAEINDEILDAWGGSWCAPPLTEAEMRLAPSGTAVRIQDCIRPWLATGKSWLWKDPRLTLTLPVWKQDLPPMVAVISVRNPLAIWLSLYQRDRFPKASSFLLWEVYMRAAIRHARGLRHMFVQYEDLIDKPRETVDAVACYLERAGAVFPAAASLDPAYHECVAALQHHRSSHDAFFEDEAATESQKGLYRLLLSAEQDLPLAVPDAMTTPAPVARELLAHLQSRHQQAQRARLDEERFLVLDGRLGQESMISRERFEVLDSKAGEERVLAGDRHEAVLEAISRLADEISTLRQAVRDLQEGSQNREFRLGRFRLQVFKRGAPRESQTRGGEASPPR